MTTRKLPLTLLLMMVFVSTVSFLPVQEARASTEIAYDNGITGGGTASVYSGVRFTTDGPVSLKKVRFGWNADGSVLEILITRADHQTLLTPAIITTTGTSTWNELDISGLGIVHSGDFWVIIHDIGAGNALYDSDGSNYDRSYYGATLPTMTTKMGSGDWLIRIVVDPVSASVGGVVMPANKLEILTPFAALAGLIAVVSTVVLVKRRRD